MMPCSPLDGLNKPFGHSCVKYYRQYFNSLAKKQCGIRIDWERGYICQVARFDPSKGVYCKPRGRYCGRGESSG